MTTPLDLEVRVVGVEAAGAKVESFNGKIEETKRVSTQASTALAATTTTATQAGQQFGRVATSLGQVGALVTGISPQFATFGQVLTQVGGATTALTGAMGPMGIVLAAASVAMGAYRLVMEQNRERTEEMTTAAEEQRTAIANLATGYEQAAGRIRAAREQFESRSVGGTAQSDADRVAGIERQLAELNASSRGGRIGGAEVREQLARMRSDLEAAQLQLAMSEGAQTRTEAGAALQDFAAADRERAGRRGGPRPENDNAIALEYEYQQAVAEGGIRRAEWEEQQRMERLAGERDVARQIEELKAFNHELDMQRKDALEARQDELNERAIEAIEKQKDALRTADEERRAASEELSSDMESTLGPVVSGLTDALRDVIAGTKSADEAFQGLLASFLEMIAQRAALEAAAAFAQAIGKFASQDYGGGALSLAAGVAWTAVAVAAGAASIAVAPPAEAAPAAPQAGSGGQGGGQTYTFNINGPLLTSGSRANLGRELGGLIGEGERRFGRAA